MSAILDRTKRTFVDRFYDGWSFVLVLFAVALPAIAGFTPLLPLVQREVNAEAIGLVSSAFQYVAGFGMLGAIGLALSAARDEQTLPQDVGEFVGDFLGHWAFLAAHVVPGVGLAILGLGALFARDFVAALPAILAALLLGALALGIWCAVMQTVMAVATTFRGRIVGAVFAALLIAQFGSSLGGIPFMSAIGGRASIPLEPGAQFLILLNVLSPSNVVGGLVETLVHPHPIYTDRYAEAFPMFHHPWFYGFATLLWFAVPLLLGAWRVRTQPPVEPQDPASTPEPEQNDEEVSA